MTDAFDRVLQITSRRSGVSLTRLSANSALSQDIGMSGDDVEEYAEALAKQLGADVKNWPWSRYVELNEPHVFTALYYLWRLLTWPWRGRLLDPHRVERLELGHIAAVIDRGEWFEP